MNVLNEIEELRIYQELEFCEILFRIETKNRYRINTTDGELLLYAVEHSCFLCRWICRSSRPFRMSIYDMYGRELVRLQRRLACTGCCFPCCPLQKVRVFSPPGKFVGTVEESYHCWSSRFVIKNSFGKVVFEIRGPCYARCPGASIIVADFKIFNLKGKEIGRITKEWGGLLRELFTNSDFFALTFPKHLCPLQKVRVFSPPGKFVGTVEESYHCWSSRFVIKNSFGKVVFEIRGPCYARCPGASIIVADFKIFNLKGKEIGRITKEWGGLLRELFTNSDFFALTFPKHLNKDLKVILLSAP
ncbi:phospholipid scramblase 2-like, partial [Halyomorpha halys]|uniref:phospholipid scramblase 2-like n=1 Tax=Halyomorpha halys TaxID=286706 RepID=UPI0034D2984B